MHLMKNSKMDPATLHETIRTLKEYVHMLMNTDKICFILVLCLLIYSIFDVYAKYVNRKKVNPNRLPQLGEENEKVHRYSPTQMLNKFAKLKLRFPLWIKEELRNESIEDNSIEDKRIEYFEEWRNPVLCFGKMDKKIKDFFEDELIDIDQDDWDVSCKIVDRVLKIVVGEMRKGANKRFPGLALGKTLKKQGSSREGLKVYDPLEFDVLLPFLLENIKTKNDVVFDNNGRVIPGLFKMEIMDPNKLPSWWRSYGLLFYEQEKSYINTSNFHKKVFASLLDQTRAEINNQLKKLTKNTNDWYALVRSVISPSLKITIQVRSGNGLRSFDNILDNFEVFAKLNYYNQVNLEIDLVPGILLSIDKFPKNIFNKKSVIYCERYGVMKWVNKKNQHIPKQDGDLIWRNSSCGYEKCIFDIAQRKPSQLYVMTACRLLKWALRKVASDQNNQLGSVLKSYHLKTICLYCVLFLTIPSKNNNLFSVTEAMGYFIEFIRLSLEAENLPHFFHGNPHLQTMFSGDVFGGERTTYNMFAMNSLETLKQARLGFVRFKNTLSGMYLEKHELNSEKIDLFASHLQRISEL